jgi:predicted O-linked N-acetylglucosamine transferase (SPINDLY family)
MDLTQTVQAAQAALDARRWEEAAAHLRAAVQLAPRAPALWNELGTTLARLGQIDHAEVAFRQALSVKPDYRDAQHNLALALFHLNRLDEAESIYRVLLASDPRDATAQFGTGTIYERRAQLDQARRAYEAAIEIEPRLADAHINLGNVLWEMGRHSDAHAAMNSAVALAPRSIIALRNLAVLFHRAGLIDRELEQYRRVLALNPSHDEAATINSQLLAGMFYQSPYSPQLHFDEHVRWANRFADPMTANAAPHPNDRSAARRLRVGYVSPDFRHHPVASFLEPILRHHDRANFEVYCYANVTQPDGQTARFRELADVWRDIVPMSDDAAAQQIRDDRIDILIDLAGHTAGNRLLVLARKPAPIQVSYLGYMATTGLRAMDYRVTDDCVDPPGKAERFHTERLVRLPEKFFAYQPPAVATEPATKSPKRTNGHVTFASSNRLVKLNDELLIAWARILNDVDRSRLWLLAPGSRSAAERCLAVLEQHDVERSRVDLIPLRPYEEYLRSLSEFDIGLDAFPVSGHTTTCNTLWMGTPVVTLAGETYVSRLGADCLASLGLHDLIARDVDDYVRIAVELANDDARLDQLRRHLRSLVESRLCDGERVTRELERAYRAMWHTFCARDAG